MEILKAYRITIDEPYINHWLWLFLILPGKIYGTPICWQDPVNTIINLSLNAARSQELRQAVVVRCDLGQRRTLQMRFCTWKPMGKPWENHGKSDSWPSSTIKLPWIRDIPNFFGQIPRGSNMLTLDILLCTTQSVDPKRSIFGTSLLWSQICVNPLLNHLIHSTEINSNQHQWRP